ncbi:MAG: 3-dehydroquinate synthase [bacterium]|nr:3-dehydroquinate synthase [bacterium]
MNIVLTGYMGTGKTAVANELQKQLGWEVIDVDERIVIYENSTIDDIFTKKGEPYFRKVESKIIAELSNLDQKIIATGGGAVLNQSNIYTLKKNGLLICLSAQAEQIYQRLKGDNTRPLLKVSDPLATIKEMLKARANFYANNNYKIETINLTIQEVAKKIIKLMPQAIDVKLNQNPYKIYLNKPFQELVHFLPPAYKVLVISDTHVAPKYLVDFMTSLKEKYNTNFHLIPSGEKYKNLSEISKIYEAAIKHGLDRDSLIIALGGGVVGDMAGFAAATYLRGINYIQVPTTLLAQVDASIGGKTGVDLKHGKNLIGAFHQPSLVWIDPQFLNTLNDNEYRNGLAEVVKYSVISQGTWDFLSSNIEKILKKEPKILKKMLEISARAKAQVVSEDEKEAGLRKILNLGHTLGHALEANFNYEYKHGEMVAVGIIFASHLASKLKICNHNIETELQKTLLKILPNSKDGSNLIDKIKNKIKNKQHLNHIMDIMAKDKKMSEGKIDFIVPEKIGKVRLESLQLDTIKDILSQW